MPTDTRRARLERDHPRLYAARHVAKGAGQVALAIVGVTFLLSFVPDVSIDIDLPHVDLPDLPLPRLDLEVPGWVKAVLRSKKYWLPIVIGIFVALGEVERRRNKVTRDDDRA